jgi:predicted nucleic-acid-binding protein
VKVAIDTSVLVRYLTEDDEAQAAAAAKIIEAASVVLISTIVLAETTWVLRRAYKHTPMEVAAALRSFINAQGVEADEAAAEAGLRFLEQGGDFADGVIAHEAKRHRCDCLVTFDRKFAQLSNGAATLLVAD